jgi:hypothetical protein
MVPLSNTELAEKPTAKPVPEVRRLPPIDSSVASPAEQATVSPNRGIPIYPSTGIR